MSQKYLLIDKPKGLTSHDVVDTLRRITGVKKIGHAGTLDPNATGLLIIGIGRESTKNLWLLANQSTKEYEAEIFLGETKDTFDAEGMTISTSKFMPRLSEVELVLKKMIGKQKQLPPRFSAVKIGGKKAYELARKGLEFVIPSREVIVHSIDLINYNYPKLKFVTKVSSGTYIRSLAYDIGNLLGCGAYLKELRRLRVGMYSVNDAVGLEKLNSNNWQEFVRDKI